MSHARSALRRHQVKRLERSRAAVRAGRAPGGQRGTRWLGTAPRRHSSQRLSTSVETDPHAALGSTLPECQFHVPSTSTHCFAHRYQRQMMCIDSKQRQSRARKRAGHQSKHCVLMASIEQLGPIISGFGVRVPGGAQQPRSQQCPGFLHVLSGPLTDHLAQRLLRAESPLTEAGHTSAVALARSGHLSSLHPIVTVRHITSLRIVAVFSDSPHSPPLSSHQPPTLEA